MTSLEAYKTFLSKINKNDRNTNINVGKGEFVLIYNEQKDVWLAQQLAQTADTAAKNHLAELLVHDKEVVKVGDTDKFAEFEVPEDLFQYEASISIANKGRCKGRVLYNWDFKPKNKNALLQDENNNPSFEYEQTLINLAGDKVLVFKTDFDVERQFLTYYKEVKKIDLEGYKTINGSPSVTINPDEPDHYVNEIVNLCAVEVIRRYENPDGFQLAKDRTNQDLGQ
jgi:uncharacterized protein with GYD domain